MQGGLGRWSALYALLLGMCLRQVHTGEDAPAKLQHMLAERPAVLDVVRAVARRRNPPRTHTCIPISWFDRRTEEEPEAEEGWQEDIAVEQPEIVEASLENVLCIERQMRVYLFGTYISLCWVSFCSLP